MRTLLDRKNISSITNGQVAARRVTGLIHHHHHLPYSTGHFFSVLRTGLYASSPEPHECHGNGNGQANIECYVP